MEKIKEKFGFEMNYSSENQSIKEKTLSFLLNYLQKHYYLRRKTFIYDFLTSYLKIGKTKTKYNDLSIFLSKIITKLSQSGILQKHSRLVFRVKHINNNANTIEEIVFSIPYISNSQIRTLYLRKKLTINEISEIIGVNGTTIRERLKGMGLNTKGNYHPPEKELKVKNEEIEKLYIEENLSLREISEIAQCCIKTISRRLEGMGVELRESNKRKKNN